MQEAKIVFCKRNHIYDMALHEECPYCKKIQKEQQELSRSLESFGFARAGDEYEDDVTELLHPEEDDATELLFTKEEDDATELLQRDTDEEDKTELLWRR